MDQGEERSAVFWGDFAGLAALELGVEFSARLIGEMVDRRMLQGMASVQFQILFDLSDLARGAVLIQATMPVAVFNYLFAQYYSRQPEQVAGMVMLSTILSFLTLPLLLWAVL